MTASVTEPEATSVGMMMRGEIRCYVKDRLPRHQQARSTAHRQLTEFKVKWQISNHVVIASDEQQILSGTPGQTPLLGQRFAEDPDEQGLGRLSN